MKIGEILQTPKAWKSLVVVSVLISSLITALHHSKAKYEREMRQDGNPDIHVIYLKANTWSPVFVTSNNRVTTFPDSAVVEYQDGETGRIVVVPPNSRDYPLGMTTARIRSSESIKYIVERR